MLYVQCLLHTCRGAETTSSVPLRYHQLTTTNFIVRDEAATDVNIRGKLQLLQLTTNVDIHCHVICWRPKRLPSMQMKKINFFIHEIFQIKPCKHFIKYVLSFYVKYRSVQARFQKYFLKHACKL